MQRHSVLCSLGPAHFNNRNSLQDSLKAEYGELATWALTSFDTDVGCHLNAGEHGLLNAELKAKK